MIADVLFDAVAKIQDYLAEQPTVLTDFHADILHLCADMSALAEKLDLLPPD